MKTKQTMYRRLAEIWPLPIVIFLSIQSALPEQVLSLMLLVNDKRTLARTVLFNKRPLPITQ
jgi:hypothetical protein